MKLRSKALTAVSLLSAILVIGNTHASGASNGIFYGLHAGPHGPFLLCLSPDYSSARYEDGNVTRRLESSGKGTLIERDAAGESSGTWDFSNLHTAIDHRLNDYVKRSDAKSGDFYPVRVSRLYLPSDPVIQCSSLSGALNAFTLRTDSKTSSALHALSVSAGSGFTCVLLDSHRPRCWGDDGNGAVGSDQGTQVAHIALTDIASLEVDDFISYAQLANGKLYRWGGGPHHGTGDHPEQIDQRQLDSGYDQGNPCQPTPSGDRSCIQRTNRVTLIAQAGERTPLLAVVSHRCKVANDGGVGCEGDLWPHQEDQYGNLRPPVVNGSALNLFKTTRVPIGRAAISVVSGRRQDCALLVDHTVSCWFYRGTVDQPLAPLVALPLHDVRAISGNQEDMCALLENGSVRCWSDLYASRSDSRNLIVVSGITQATQISVGPDHGCAVLKGGGLSCWGANHAGALGSLAHWGTDNERYAAYPVMGFASAGGGNP